MGVPQVALRSDIGVSVGRVARGKHEGEKLRQRLGGII